MTRSLLCGSAIAFQLAAQTSLPGIGADQRQCWSPDAGLAGYEREVPLSDLLLEREGGDCRKIATRPAWQSKRGRIAASWRLLLGEEPGAAPPLAPRVIWEEKKTGYILRKVAYRVEPDEEISSYLLIPEGLAGKAPALMALMPTTAFGKEAMIGHAENESWWYPLELVARGYVVLAPEVITTGDRVTPGAEPFDTEGFYRKHPQWSVMGKMLWDHRRGVDYLETLAQVDRKRIGTVGFSLGAHNAAFLAAFDARIAAVVSNAGVIHFAGAANPFAWAREPMSEGRVGRFTYMAPLKKYLLAGETPTDLHEVQALIAPRPYLDMNSVADSWRSGLAASSGLRRLYAFLGAPEHFDYFVFDGGHSFPRPIRSKAYEWLDRHLKPGTR